MSTRKKALLSFPLIVIMVFSLLVPMQIQAYAATDNYAITSNTSKIKEDYVGNVWKNSKSYIYLVSEGSKYSLVRQNRSTGKVKTLVKRLPNTNKYGEGDYYMINAIYGNYVYLTREGNYDSTVFRTYKYNLKTKKLIRLAAKCGIMEQRGKYLFGGNEYPVFDKATKHSLYKVVDGGKLEKIKSLGHIYNPMKVGKYLYYEYSEDSSLNKVKVYRIRFNGKDKECLGSFKSKNANMSVYCDDFHAKWCRVIKNGKAYKYTYKTKKLTLIKN